jgi:hypothetical protein
MTTRGSWLTKLIMAVGAAIAALAIAAPLASAAPARLSAVKGFSEDPTTFGSLASCQNIFTGPVTFQNGTGHIRADIDGVTFSCGAGTSVTANALPWKLDLQRDVSYTISGIDVDISTAEGTCRYTGSVDGVTEGAEIGPDVYDLRGTLNRQSAGCGGPDQINVGNLIEVVSFS